MIQKTSDLDREKLTENITTAPFSGQDQTVDAQNGQVYKKM